MHLVTAKSLLLPQGGMNIYRGCTHGCIYCDSRSTCYQMRHPFEDIEVKQNAPALLEDALRRRRRRCMISTGAMSDPYIPLEKELCLTRRCLEVIHRYGFGAAVQTKSDLILRDAELLAAINKRSKCVVQMTLTTYDEALCRLVEPAVCTTHRRWEVLKEMQRLGIPTVVWFCPVLPFMNDTEENLRGILDYCFDAGVKGIVSFGIGLTLREGDREYFFAALDRHFPGMKQRYVQTFGNQYECTSDQNAALMAIFDRECERRGILHYPNDVFRYLHEFPQRDVSQQLSMFD